MKTLSHWISQFCYRHPNFGIPNLMMYIAVGNVAIGLIDNFSAYPLSSALFFFRPAILHGEIWRLISFIFVPITGDFGILNFTVPGTSFFMTVLSAYFYYWIGSLLEREWGTAKFNCFYFSGVVLNIIFGMIMGVSSIAYVNMSMFFAFAVLFPNMQVLFMFILPVKVKWLAWIDAAYFALQVLLSLLGGNLLGALLPVIAILNFIVFFWTNITDEIAWRRGWAKHQTSHQTIQFKAAARQQKKREEERGYRHKCAVCGRTDTEWPDLEFRYCSRCQGYHCFCQEHIFNHVHFNE